MILRRGECDSEESVLLRRVCYLGEESVIVRRGE